MRRLRIILTVCIFAGMMVLLWGGGIRFPDAPIVECSTGFCGKWGSHHSSDDYRLFRLWDTILWIYWPVAILALLLLNWRQFKVRR